MRNVSRSVLASIMTALPLMGRLHGAAFAERVVAYDHGSGYATEFGSGLGYTLTDTALGQPNPQTEFGPVTPFSPPFARQELVSVGAGGHLTVEMGAVIENAADHPFGLDFIIYGSAGFIDVDYPNGRTDELGSTFGHSTGTTRVWVSLDGQQYFLLDPLRAPVVDGLFPTDGAGVWGRPVNPGLGSGDLANRDLSSLRALYEGSAGGTGYDLSWALDGSGQPMALGSARFVRVEVWSGRAEIDGLAVVPEPGGWGLLCAAMLAAAVVHRITAGWRRAGEVRTTWQG